MESKLRLGVMLINRALGIFRLQPETCSAYCPPLPVESSKKGVWEFFCGSGCDYFPGHSAGGDSSGEQIKRRLTATVVCCFFLPSFLFLSLCPLQMPAAAAGLKGEPRPDF